MLKQGILYYIFFLLSAGHAYGQYSPQTQISLLTCDSGTELYSTFGHSAIRVFDPLTRFDQVYNYGTFNAFEDNFYMKFLRGKLKYKLSRYSYGKFLQEYHYDKRGVIEQKLQLDSLTQHKLFQFLEHNNLPENQYYLYDFFFDNCSTRIRDIVESEMPGFRYVDTITEEKTFRNLLDEHLMNNQWSDFGIDLIIGARADELASFREQMFLPKYLSEHLEKGIWLKNGNEEQLLTKAYSVLDFKDQEVNQKSFQFTPLLLFSFLLIIELLITFTFFRNKKIKALQSYELLVFAITGMAGLFMLLMWFGTDHVACGNNWNILWANPFFLILAIALMVKKNIPALRIFLIICLLLALFGWSFIPQAYHLAFIPIILWLLLILTRQYIFRKMNLNTV